MSSRHALILSLSLLLWALALVLVFFFAPAGYKIILAAVFVGGFMVGVGVVVAVFGGSEHGDC